MTMNDAIRPLKRAGAVLAVALLVACVPPATSATSATHPAQIATRTPCADSSYVKLQQQDPDSLSAREWQRLQTLDGQCGASRAQASAGADGTMGSRHGAGHMMGVGIVTIMMVAMMIAM